MQRKLTKCRYKDKSRLQLTQGVAAAIFDDCYYLFTEFVKIQFDHELREANAVAHELASMAKGSSQSVWIYQYHY
jgi:hypothetical protein